MPPPCKTSKTAPLPAKLLRNNGHQWITNNPLSHHSFTTATALQQFHLFLCYCFHYDLYFHLYIITTTTCNASSTGITTVIHDSTVAKSCPHPAVPLYAQVTLSPTDSSGLLKFGSTATYQCDDGYELFGPALRTCHSSGKWTGDLPYCGKYHVRPFYLGPKYHSPKIVESESTSKHSINRLQRIA